MRIMGHGEGRAEGRKIGGEGTVDEDRLSGSEVRRADPGGSRKGESASVSGAPGPAFEGSMSMSASKLKWVEGKRLLDATGWPAFSVSASGHADELVAQGIGPFSGMVSLPHASGVFCGLEGLCSGTECWCLCELDGRGTDEEDGGGAVSPDEDEGGQPQVSA